MDKDFQKSSEQARDETETIATNSRRGFLMKSSLLLAGGSTAAWLAFQHRERIQAKWLELGTELISEPRKPDSERRNSKPEDPSLREYRAFLASQQLPFLSPEEIIRPQFKYRSGVCSGVPPRNLWRNMLEVASVANEIRSRLGVPLRNVISAYRSPQYNAKCPGASKYSQHLQNRALDLVYDCSPKKAFDMAVKLRDEGYFVGGVGVYSSFIHIDTRGRDATWGV